MASLDRAPASPSPAAAADTPRMNRIWSWVSALSLGRVSQRGPRLPRTLYLSFDDGPHPEHSAQVLRVLAEHQARATFFFIGNQAQRHAGMGQAVVQAGHRLGNHSMTHPYMQRLGPAAQLRELAQADLALRALDGQARHPYRPPRGRSTLTTLANSLLRHQQRTVLWTVDSLDFRLAGPEVVARLSGWPLVDGDVLLFHDDSASSWQALQVLLPQWRAQGWNFGLL